MGKERRIGGPTRRGDLNNARGTPYSRPSGSSQNPANARERDFVRGGESSQPAHRQHPMQDNDAERRSSWSSWVYTPLKALKESYMYLSKSPIKTDEVDDNVGGHLNNQTASSTAAELVEEGEAQSQKAADQYSSMEEQAGPSQPVDIALPERLLGTLPTLPSRLDAVTPVRPSEGAGSSYEDIRARNVTLLSNSPLAAGSPWQPRLRPGSGSVQPSPAQSSGAAGTPMGQPPTSLLNRPFNSVGPSRFGLRDGPAPSPLALTPAVQPFRTTAHRGNKPFARTPIHMQPLSSVPPGSVPASAAGAAAAPEPAPLSWTPMRTYSSMQPRAGATLSLKRGRTDGSPLGTPLLGAGLAADSDRRIRRRGEQGERSAERRVWKAGQTPYSTKGAAGRDVLAIEGPSASEGTQVANGLLGKREPLPMTESARRIAMALDAMLPTASSQGPADTAGASTPQKPVAPPSDSLGVAPAPLLSTVAPAPASSSSLALPLTLPLDAFPKPATLSWGSQPPPASSAVQAAPTLGQWSAAATAAPPAASWSSWSPAVALPDLTTGKKDSPPSPTPSAAAALPLTPVGPSLPQPSLFKFSNAHKVDNTPDGPAAMEESTEVVSEKFSFRPARSLLDSAEKLKQQAPPVQPQRGAVTPEKVLAENNRAAAAASQPLPVSDDEDDEENLDEDGSEDGDIKGVMRSSARTEENGNAPEAAIKEAATPAPASGGWDLSFLKKNQAQAAAATDAAEKAIAAEKSGAPSQPQASAATGGWGADFLSANKAAVGAATAAAKADLDKEAGKSSSGATPAPFTISFGKPQTPAPDTAASSGSGLLSFLGSVVPGSSSTAFAPSTFSGFGFGLKQPAEASDPAATCSITAVAPATSSLPAFLASSTPAAHNATENGDAAVSLADGPGWALPKKAKANDVSPPSAGFTLDGTAMTFSFPGASSSSAPATTAAATPSHSQPAPYSFGAATEGSKLAKTATATATADDLTAAAASEAPAGASIIASKSFGAPVSFGFCAAFQPASSAAASTPFPFGASSAATERPAKDPIMFQLKPRAAPFAPSTGSPFGKPAADAGKEDSQKLPESVPTGLSLTQAQGSGRSLDSNMSVSPSAGSAGAANPFVALETGPTPVAPSTTGFPSFMIPASSAAAASSFTFGAGAASAAAISGFLAPAASTGMGFRSGSIPTFGGPASTPAFEAGAASAPAQSSAAVGMFGANANSGFGAAASAPPFGAPPVTAPAFGVASTPAFGATQSGSLVFGASGTPAFGASSTPAFGAGSAPAFGASTVPSFGQASTPAFGAGSAPAFGGFGGGGGGGFGAPAAPAFGGFGGAVGAFGAPPQSASAAGAPFGASHTAPAWGAQATSTPTFGQAPAQPSANAAPGPFGAPLQPAFGLQQQQQPAPANPFGFQGAPSGGIGGDAASGFTMGAGDSQQQGQQGQMARRKVKVKRKGR